MSLATVVVCARIGFDATGRASTALLTAGLVAFLPQFTFRGSQVSNDALVTTMAACAVWGMVTDRAARLHMAARRDDRDRARRRVADEDQRAVSRAGIRPGDPDRAGPMAEAPRPSERVGRDARARRAVVDPQHHALRRSARDRRDALGRAAVDRRAILLQRLLADAIPARSLQDIRRLFRSRHGEAAAGGLHRVARLLRHRGSRPHAARPHVAAARYQAVSCWCC